MPRSSRSSLTGDPADNDEDNLDRDAFLRASTEIDPEDLNAEFVQIPGQLARWNALYAEAHKRHAIAKIDYDRAWAQTYITIKAESEGKKGLTVDALKAACDNDADLYDLQVAVAVADAERIKLRGIVEAVMAKKDMLQSLGAKLREEMRGDPTLRSNALTG